MTTLKNLKFRITSPEQSERLQNVLFGLGYKWCGGETSPINLHNKYLYAYLSKTINFGDLDPTFESHDNEETDTEAFIAIHTDKPFEGLEEAYNETKTDTGVSPWFTNDGAVPNVDDGVLIDVMFRDGEVHEEVLSDVWAWEIDNTYNIIKWRYTNASDYYKAPKTKANLPKSMQGTPEVVAAEAVMDMIGGVEINYVETPPRNKYSREIKLGVWADVYDVLRAFAVTDPCLQHLVKKALAVGQRGHKDAAEDYDDIVKSAIRAQELNKEWHK